MATSDYERMLTERGYQIVASDFIAPIVMFGFGRRRPILTGRRQVGGALVEVQLQDAFVYNSRGLAGVARITSPAVKGDGSLRPSFAHGFLASILSGPWLALLFLIPLLLVGVWAVMLPGVFLVWLVTRGAHARQGVQRFDDLASSSTGWRYAVWGADHEAARAAMPTTLQDALIASRWSGPVGVHGGAMTLDCPIGFGRHDLFRRLLDATEAATSAIGR